MTLTAFNRRRRERAVTQAAVEPAPPSPSPPADRPLGAMKKGELLALASERGRDVPATATKAEILALLEEPAAESETE